jgi:diguanylate cyclase (GGDEF)-like protein/PAS domain S-box-containing protein
MTRYGAPTPTGAHIDAADVATMLDAGSGDAIALCSTDGTLWYASRACERLTGWAPEVLVGRGAEALLHPDDRLGAIAVRSATRSSPSPYVWCFRLLRRDDTYRWVEGIFWRVTHPREPGRTMILASVRDIGERKRTEHKLQREASTDSLTGMANRRLLLDRLGHALARLERRPAVLALIYLDLDRFKDINDSLGHRLGDWVLTVLAERAAASLRPTDTLARLGGDEFVVLAEDLTSPEEAIALARRTCEGIARPVEVPGGAVVCTASAGVATTRRPDHGSDLLLHEADLALYRAKQRGRHRVVVYDEQVRATVAGRDRAEEMVRAAVRERQLVLRYQPIISVADGRCVAAEAVVRIRSGDKLLPPPALLDVSDATGLPAAIDRQVLPLAARAAAGWTAPPHGSVFGGVSLNVTGRHLSHRGLVADLAAVLRDHALPPGALGLEIREAALAGDGVLLRKARDLRSLGVPITLQGFGCGRLSLAELHQLPVDHVKIDARLVRPALVSPAAAAVLAAVVALVHACGFTAGAARLQTADQLRVLVDAGFDRAQGALLAPPLEASALSALLDEQSGLGAGRSVTRRGSERAPDQPPPTPVSPVAQG